MSIFDVPFFIFNKNYIFAAIKQRICIANKILAILMKNKN